MEERRLTPGDTVEQVARNSHGRLLALLAERAGDISAAEDALSDAFVAALARWTDTGTPANPEAWIFTVARNRLRDRYRSAAERTSVSLGTVDEPMAMPEDTDPDAIPDKRLALLFTCAHPAIDPASRTPLMLQTVLGLDAGRISQAYALPRSAMAQRLVRAKRRITAAGIPFRVPDRREMPERLAAVLEAIYGAYAIEWQVVSGTSYRESLAAEALYLAELLAGFLPAEPEVLGLAALLCLSTSRTPARTSPGGGRIGLDEQDTTKWDAAAIARGESYLERAHGLESIGRFQPAWATRAHLLANAGRAADAVSAYEKAISLTTDTPTRAWLAERSARIAADT